MINAARWGNAWVHPARRCLPASTSRSTSPSATRRVPASSRTSTTRNRSRTGARAARGWRGVGAARRWACGARSACSCACTTPSISRRRSWAACTRAWCPVCVNTLLTADDYAYMLEHSRAQALVRVGRAVADLRAGAWRAAAHEVATSSCRGPPRRCRRTRSNSARWLARAAARGAARRRHRAPTTSRSGCTHRDRRDGPKGTVHTHANLLLDGRALRPAGARHPRGRRRVLGGQALLRVRPRQRAHVSAVGRAPRRS